MKDHVEQKEKGKQVITSRPTFTTWWDEEDECYLSTNSWFSKMRNHGDTPEEAIRMATEQFWIVISDLVEREKNIEKKFKEEKIIIKIIGTEKDHATKKDIDAFEAEYEKFEKIIEEGQKNRKIVREHTKRLKRKCGCVGEKAACNKCW